MQKVDDLKKWLLQELVLCKVGISAKALKNHASHLQSVVAL